MRSVTKTALTACFALVASALPASSVATSGGTATESPVQARVTSSSALPCSVSVLNPRWNASHGTIDAQVNLVCWNTPSGTLVRIDGFFGSRSGGSCGNPNPGPYLRLWEGSQYVTTSFGSPGVSTAYLPSRASNPAYGASQTYYARATAYVASAAVSTDRQSETVTGADANSQAIGTDSSIAYVGGQCQG